MPGSLDNSCKYLNRSLVRRTELNRQQQLRSISLAHQSRGDDIAPGAPGPKAKAKAQARGKGPGTNRSGGGNASADRSRSVSRKNRSKAPQGVCLFSFRNSGSSPPNMTARMNIARAHPPALVLQARQTHWAKSGSRTRRQGPPSSKNYPCRFSTTGTCR